MSIAGAASAEGTQRFHHRCSACDPSHVRPFQDAWASSIGFGTYLGDADDRTDALYEDALRAAVSCGCNLLDTAINYRCQRSERLLGRTLESLIGSGAIARDEVLLCTKGGYLAFDGQVPADPARYVVDTIIEPGVAAYDEIVAGCHCLAPSYLNHALRTSLANLRLTTIDVYYLHNPEQQLDEIDRDTFLQRMSSAFAWLEQRVQEGAVRCYGIATWNGLRCAPTARAYLSLEVLTDLAAQAGGPSHHFRAIQLPYNLAMPEASSFRNQTIIGETMTVLQAAERLNVSVVISASLLQSQLAQLPAVLSSHIPDLSSSAQRAIQFVRSTPGITTALVGMKQRRHVEENLALAHHPLLSPEQLGRLFDRGARSPSGAR